MKSVINKWTVLPASKNVHMLKPPKSSKSIKGMRLEERLLFDLSPEIQVENWSLLNEHLVAWSLKFTYTGRVHHGKHSKSQNEPKLFFLITSTDFK